MKPIYISLFILLSCLCFEKTYAQQYTMCGADTITISLDNYQIGSIEWQESYDSTNWVTIENEHDLVLRYFTTEEKYLRAVATTSTCEQVTTYSVFIQQKPVANAGIDQEIAGNKVMLNGNFAPYTTGFWSIVNGTGGTLIKQDSLSAILAGNLNYDYTITWTLNNSCGTSIDSVHISFIENVFNQNFIIVDATDSILSDSIQLLQGIYQIQFSELITGINDSCLLVGISGDGFLRKVISFDKLNDSLYIFYTEQAYWEDYCLQGVLNIGSNIFPDNNNPKSANQLVSVEEFPTRKEILTDPKYKKGTFSYTKTEYYQVGQRLKSLESDDLSKGYSIDFLNIKYSPLDNELGSDEKAEMLLNGNLTINPNFVLNQKTGNDPIMLGFNNATITNSLSVNCNFFLKGNLELITLKEDKFFEIKRYGLALFFGVPVLTVTKFYISLKGNLYGIGKLKFDLIFKTKTDLNSYILIYEDKTIKSVSDSKTTPSLVYENNKEFEGEIGLNLRLQPKLEYKIGGLFGPYVSLPILNISPSICFASKETEGSLKAIWGLKIPVSLDASIGLEAGYKKFTTSTGFNFNIYNFGNVKIPVKLDLISGNNQSGLVNQKLSWPLSVRVTSSLGFGVPLVPVWFDVIENNGTLEKSMVLTDSKGYANNYLTLGTSEGLNRVKAYTYNCSFEDLTNSPVYFSANALPTSSPWICQNSSLAVGTRNNPDLTVEPFGIKGITPYTYSLDGITYSSIAPKIASNLAENQQFFVKDANGCASSTIYKSKNSCDYNPPQVTMSITGNNIQAYGSKGYPPYMYSLDIDGSYTSMDKYIGLGSGDHKLYIMDVKGCKSHKDFTISNTTKNGLVSFYPFNGNANDLSGNAYNGSVQGAKPTTDRYGTSNRAYQFTSNNDYIEVPSNALNNMPNGTVAAFIYLDQLGVQHTIIDKTITTQINYFQFIVDLNNKLRAIINTNGSVVFRGNMALTTNQWYHVAVTWDGTNTKLYLNGMQDGIYPNNKGIPDATRHTYIGKVENNTAFMKGKIDEVKVFNRALNESEIFALYHENGWGYNSPLTATVKDIEGNVYKTVKIGNQWWMAENLKTTKFNDGTAIPLVTDNTAWSNLTTPGYCWSNNDDANKNIYGALYNWYTVIDNRKLAPPGWHVPTDAEWTILENYLISNGYNYDGTTSGNKIAKSLASVTGWVSSIVTGAVGNTDYPDIRNKSGFSGLPGNQRGYSGSFDAINSVGMWWSSTQVSTNTSNAYNRYLNYNYNYVIRDTYRSKKYGFSVRCIKD